MSVLPKDMTADLFAGYPVSDYTTAISWYERLLGSPPAFLPNDIEAVWELAEHRYLFIKVLPADAGHAFNLVFVSDLDDLAAQIGRRGVEPAASETLSNGVRRVIYTDPDGNQVGFGGARLEDSTAAPAGSTWHEDDDV